MRQIDPVHRRAEALAVTQDGDLLFGVLSSETVDQMDLCPDRPLATGGGGFDVFLL